MYLLVHRATLGVLGRGHFLVLLRIYDLFEAEPIETYYRAFSKSQGTADIFRL